MGVSLISLIGGAIAGLLHRLILSPFIGKQSHKAQSVGTPAAGVMLAFVPFRLAYRYALRRMGYSKEDVDSISVAIDSAYAGVFYAYGLVVVLTIQAKIGGVRDS